ncbi:MAG: hypothetical protein Q9159_006713 [Coniocarpon cinnabarinum]
MSSEAASSILDQIVETIIGGGFPSLSQRKLQVCSRTDLRSLLKEFDPATESQRHLKRLFDDEPTRKRRLLLHGLLAGGIVMFAFVRMRWRVNYGLDPSRTLLAVPYRAKDVPSPRSEFSHSDVAILLTCLSHYYGDLTDSQLAHVLQEIQKRDDGADEHAHWSLQLPTLPQSYRAVIETWSTTKQDGPQWITQKVHYDAQRRVYIQKDGSIVTRADAIELLEGDAQTIEERYVTTLAEPNDDSLLAHQGLDDHLQANAQEFAISLRQSSTYAEEQERELSPEIERERGAERPNREQPYVYAMHTDVLALVRFGTFNKASTAFVPAFEVFQQTTARALFTADEFLERIWVTRDFVNTIEPSVPCNLDEFLKPVQWVLRLRDGEKCSCVVLSPYEANKAMPDVLQYGATELVVYSPRVSRTPRPFDEFSFGGVDHALLQTNNRLDLFLRLFAGQLYLKNYQQYKNLCRFSVYLEQPLLSASTVPMALLFQLCGRTLTLPGTVNALYGTVLWHSCGV